jgi:hypothetical protein
MKTFRVIWSRSGLVYSPKYCKTLTAAIRSASLNRWCETNGMSKDFAPHIATIYFGSGETGWEVVATIDSDGVKARPTKNRPSVVEAMEKIAMHKQTIAEAEAMEQEIVTIAKAKSGAK